MNTNSVYFRWTVSGENRTGDTMQYTGTAESDRLARVDCGEARAVLKEDGYDVALRCVVETVR